MTDARDTATRPREKGGALPGRKRRGERLVGLMIAGFILLNFPVLSVFSIPRMVFGIPLLYVYLFSVWVLLIIVMVLIFRDRPARPSAGRKETKG